MIPNLHRRRRHERRVLAWSVAVAVLLHAAAFVYWSGLRADELLERVARGLLYEWLPSDRFPAPVDLVQPVAILEASR